MAFNIYHIYRRLQPGFRQKRIEIFLQALKPSPSTRILDVGGEVANWEGVVPISSPITCLNLAFTHRGELPKRYACLIGDGCNMDFPDGSYDIVFSNSVIEHVGDYERQKRFASEVRRVGRMIFVQTPNRWFFIEPHFLALFVHFLPAPLARFLLRYCSFRALFRKGDNADLKKLANEVRLLSYREFKELFPDCEIHREKWFGMTKSFTAIRR